MDCLCNNGNIERAWVGTGLKFAINITAEGFSMEDDDFKCVFQRGKKTLTVDKSEMNIADDGTFIANVDSSLLGAGTLSVITYAYVPDEDWEGGIRPEVHKQDILYINAI